MPKKKADLAEWTDEQVEAEKEALAQQRADLKARLRELTAEQDRRVVAAKVSKLTDAEKAALVQAIQAEGLPSAESVGTPGG